MGAVSWILPALAGGLLGAGLWLLLKGFAGNRDRPTSFKPPDLKRLLPALGLGLGGWLVTQIFIVGLLVGVGTALFKGRLGTSSDTKLAIARSEAIAAWTEMLYSILAAGGGIEKAITISAPMAPLAIKSEVETLSVRLQNLSLPAALSKFSEEVKHPVADKIAAALSLSSTRGAGDLVGLLRSQVISARAESRVDMELESGRARHRTSSKIIMGVTLAIAVGLYLFEDGYLDPYRAVQGQLVLCVVGLGFMLGFWLLVRMGSENMPQRYFEAFDETRAASTGVAL